MSQSYQCHSCGTITPAPQLARGAWGDALCPSCHSPDVERVQSRFAQWYAIFFLYKVY